MQAVILAAGESSRFWPLNQKHKILLKIMGKPLIWYTVDGLRRAGIKDLIIIQGPRRDIEKELNRCKVPSFKIKYIIQKKPIGMGNALWEARNSIKDNFFVLNAERVDSEKIIKTLKSKIKNKRCNGVIAGKKTRVPEFYGIMRLKGDRILGIIEKPQRNKAPSNIRVVGFYFLTKDFFKTYKRTKKQAYDFEQSLSLYAKKNDVRVAIVDKNTPSFKYPWHLFRVEKYLFDKFLIRKIEKTAKVAKNAIIEGKVYIGSGAKVFEGAVIKGPCYIGSNCVIGNNTLIRDYTNLEKGALVGTFTEIKHSISQENFHSHYNYLGNSIFGKECTVGAGTITANRRIDRQDIKAIAKGKKIDTGSGFLGAIVGEKTKIGINTSLMPGILIGSNCVIGPNSLVMENIEDNMVFYDKFQEVIKKRSLRG